VTKVLKQVSAPLEWHPLEPLSEGVANRGRLVGGLKLGRLSGRSKNPDVAQGEDSLLSAEGGPSKVRPSVSRRTLADIPSRRSSDRIAARPCFVAVAASLASTATSMTIPLSVSSTSSTKTDVPSIPGNLVKARSSRHSISLVPVTGGSTA
jgi:hypothetical protein